MPELKRYHIFISHAWSYGNEYDKIVQFLNNAPYFQYFNYSAPEDKPITPPGTTISKNQLKLHIENKIRHANIVIVLAGMYANYSEWIQYEIEAAKMLGKPIIAIKPWGQERFPQYVLEEAIDIVGWNTESIISSIRKHSI